MMEEAEPEDGVDVLLVHDRRHGWPRRTHRLTGWQVQALRRLEDGRTEPALHRLLTGDGHDIPAEELSGWIQQAQAMGLVFRDGRTYVSLPTWDVPDRIDPDPAPQSTDRQEVPG
ncbi:hypothetical protein ACIQ6K_15660 [Streptomyces sp. NPDC096354]|uniref:hypothetical protein n=1 Tax=Streptomyces sp. NPDC096354 TaxID=3366088 RepID=UPI003823D38B